MSLDEAQTRHKAAGRNDQCPCGSGKKYKRCHQIDDDKLINAELRRLSEEAQARADAEAAKTEEKKSEGKEKPGATGSKARDPQHAPTKGRGAKLNTPKSSSDGGKAQSLPRRGAV